MPTETMAPEDIDILHQLNRDYIRSVQASDVRRFDEVLAEDFLCGNPDGSLVDRGDLESRGPRRARANHGRRGHHPRADDLYAARWPGGLRSLHGRLGAPRRPLAGRVGPRHPLLRRASPTSRRGRYGPIHAEGWGVLAAMACADEAREHAGLHVIFTLNRDPGNCGASVAVTRTPSRPTLRPAGAP